MVSSMEYQQELVCVSFSESGDDTNIYAEVRVTCTCRKDTVKFPAFRVGRSSWISSTRPRNFSRSDQPQVKDHHCANCAIGQGISPLVYRRVVELADLWFKGEWARRQEVPHQPYFEPLIADEVAELVTDAQEVKAAPQVVEHILRRLIRAIPEITLPYPDPGPVHGKLAKLSDAFYGYAGYHSGPSYRLVRKICSILEIRSF
jgi:hypothetical protein